MSKEKSPKLAPLLAILGGYFAINSGLLAITSNPHTKPFIIGIDIILALIIIVVVIKMVNDSNKNKLS